MTETESEVIPCHVFFDSAFSEILASVEALIANAHPGLPGSVAKNLEETLLDQSKDLEDEVRRSERDQEPYWWELRWADLTTEVFARKLASL